MYDASRVIYNPIRSYLKYSQLLIRSHVIFIHEMKQ
jgi:hypothetical protein